MEFAHLAFRTAVAFASLLIFTRLLGKQQLTHLTLFEYTAGITIGSIGATLASDIDSKTEHHLFSLFVFCLLTWLAQYMSLNSRTARRLLDGEPVIVVHNGKILEDNIRKIRYNLDELLQQLRQKDIFNIGEVEFAILEPNGNMSVQLKSQYQTVKAKDLQLDTKYKGVSSEIIIDGKVIYNNLTQNNLNEQWLKEQLANRGIDNYEQVVLAILATDGSLYVDVKQDQLQNAKDIDDDEENKNNKN